MGARDMYCAFCKKPCYFAVSVGIKQVDCTPHLLDFRQRAFAQKRQDLLIWRVAGIFS